MKIERNFATDWGSAAKVTLPHGTVLVDEQLMSLAKYPDQLLADEVSAAELIHDGETLRSIRKGLGLTQNDLASMLDLTPRAIGMMERGEMDVSKRTSLAIRYIQARDGIPG